MPEIYRTVAAAELIYPRRPADEYQPVVVAAQMEGTSGWLR